MTNLLVYNIEAASPSMIRQLDRHCLNRTPDGTSAIDLSRSHLNKVLVGNQAGLTASIADFYRDGPKPPTKQAEKPYLRIVVSASPEFFRPNNPTENGTWDQDRLDAWLQATMAQLSAEHGDDLVFVELHLDEDTPHIHAVVAPTYQKKPRRPGRKKRGETDEAFEARKIAAIQSVGERVVGRASHPELSKPGSFQRLRERMAVALDHLGIEYGEDRHGQANSKTTRQWVKEQAADLRKQLTDLEAQRAAVEAREAAVADLEAQRAAVEAREAAVADLEAQRAAVEAREGQIAVDRKNIATAAKIILAREDALSEKTKQVEYREQEVERRASVIVSISQRMRTIVGTIGEALGLKLSSKLVPALNQIEEVIEAELLAQSDEIDDPFSAPDGPSGP